MTFKEKMQESFTSFTKTERQKFRELPGISKKLRYIWDYYRYWILIPILVIAACWSIGSNIYNNLKYDQIFYCAVLNNALPDEIVTPLTEDFAAYYGLDPESETMLIDTSYVTTDPDPQIVYAASQKINAMISTRDVEIIMGEGDEVETFASEGLFYDLSEILPAETYHALSEYMIEYTYNDTYDNTSETAPFIMDLSQSELAKNGILSAQNPMAGIVINSDNPDVAVKFIEYIFGL